MFIKDGKRINIYAPAEFNEVWYPNLLDPALRDQLGVIEITEPEIPSDYTEDAYFRTEQDEAPYVVYTRKPDEMIAQAQQAKINAAALQYLADTDWMVTRFIENGTPIPEEIKNKRQVARDSVVAVEAVVP